MNLITQNESLQIYKMANDSIKSWTINNLRSFGYEKDNDWLLDSLICFNKLKNRFVASLMIRDTLFKPANSDGLVFFYGAKFNNKWFFFKGASIILPREYYQKDIHTPLSFKKLHEIALDEVYSGYLIKKERDFFGNLFEKPEYEINEDFFKGMESRNTDGSYGGNLKTFKECVIYQVNYKWKKPDKDGYIKYDHPTPEEMAR